MNRAESSQKVALPGRPAGGGDVLRLVMPFIMVDPSEAWGEAGAVALGYVEAAIAASTSIQATSMM